jgi:hypothetical protein
MVTEYGIEITVSGTIDDDFILDVIDAAGYGIGYWAARAVVDGDERTYAVTEADTGKVYRLTFADIADSIGTLAQGWDDARTAVLEDDAGYIDANLGDVIIQWACFGEIVYG